MIPVVKDITQVKQVNNEQMEELGYFARGEHGMPFRRFFQKWGKNNLSSNVHVYEQGNPEIERHIYFRDWMRVHEDDRNLYAELKNELAKEFADDVIAYCLGKEGFVVDIDRKTGFDGFRMVVPLTDREWEAYLGIIEERHAAGHTMGTLNDSLNEAIEDDCSFVLYKGTEIVCAAKLLFFSKNQAAISFLGGLKAFSNNNYEAEMKGLIEKWLRQQRLRLVSLF